MGNCFVSGSSSATVWAGDDWGLVASERPTAEKEGLLGDVGSSSAVGAGTEGQVRIRISKKQLEELLRKVENGKSGGGSSSSLRVRKIKANQILQKLIDKSDHFEIHHVRHWKPALQSIPEID